MHLVVLQVVAAEDLADKIGSVSLFRNTKLAANVDSEQRVAQNQQAQKEQAQKEQIESQQAQWRALELFAGIGGFACAVEPLENVQVVAAIDIDQQARRCYQLNWPSRYEVAEIASLGPAEMLTYGANLWWLSPPCQPYSGRGKQRDIDDPRAASLLHLIKTISTVRPSAIALENVVGFEDSRAFVRLSRTLIDCGYQMAWRVICPTEMGWPNRRPRFYLLAVRACDRLTIRDWRPLPAAKVRLRDLIESESVEGDWIEPSIIERFGDAMDRVDLDDHQAVTACFGSSYGKVLLRSGSYLQTRTGWRRFSPREVARLLGYPESFRFPAEASPRTLWRLLGNSLAIPVVRYVLSHLC